MQIDCVLIRAECEPWTLDIQHELISFRIARGTIGYKPACNCKNAGVVVWE
jgi:hypothetical protein